MDHSPAWAAEWMLTPTAKQGLTKTRAGQRSQEFWLTWALGASGFFPQATTHHSTLHPKSNSSPEEETAMLSQLLLWVHQPLSFRINATEWAWASHTSVGRVQHFTALSFQGNKSIPQLWLLHTVMEKSIGLLTSTWPTACKRYFSPAQTIPHVYVWCRKNDTWLCAIISASKSGVTDEK